jgi:hypothetical protein
VAPLVETREAQTRTRTRSVAAPTKDQRSVLMEGIENVGREIHPRTLRFGSRLIAGINPDRHHGRRRYRRGLRPAASQRIIACANRSPGPPRKHCAGFALRPRVESSRCRPRRKTYATRSRPVSRGGACPRGRLSRRLNRQSGRNALGSMRRFGRTPYGPSTPLATGCIGQRRAWGLGVQKGGNRSACHLSRDVSCGSPGSQWDRVR